MPKCPNRSCDRSSRRASTEWSYEIQAEDLTVPSRAGIHHLDLNVSDLNRSGLFYGRVLTKIGYRRIDLSTSGEPQEFDWEPTDAEDRFSIGLYAAANPGAVLERHSLGIHHLALRAKSPEAVEALYRELLEMEAEVTDASREYPQYEPGYYAVFFLDPDGVRLEYVFAPDNHSKSA